MKTFLILSALLACAFSQLISVPDSRCPPGIPFPPVFLPSLTNCNIFYTCVGGGYAFRQRCPLGKHWSVSENWCVWPDRAGCTGASETCPPTNDITVHLPHPTDCSRFFTCSWGTPFERECPAGQHWDSRNNWCDWPDRAGCTEVSDSCPPTNDITVHLPHPTDCTRYFICNWGTPVERQCPTGQEWSVANNWCDWPDRAGCSGVSDSCPPTNDITVHLPHPTDCSRFFTCSWGIPHERECPPGQHWSVSNNWCDWPDRAGCGSN